ncbi:MAG: hypothetical protein HC892_00250 [Saprospiraceae bacterium]|nr:hypothetical protein [Saprospiraceae bacterium]
MVVYSRAIAALMKMPLPAIVDDFGEYPHAVEVLESFLQEKGGEGNFIWKGEILVEVVTTIEWS